MFSSILISVLFIGAMLKLQLFIFFTLFFFPNGLRNYKQYCVQFKLYRYAETKVDCAVKNYNDKTHLFPSPSHSFYF
jgi:hypothetical protein